MNLRPAAQTNFEDIVALANLAYRGTGTGASWNVEEGILEGERLSNALLREELAAKPEGSLLVWRDAPDEPLLGTAWLNPESDGVWYLGLLTVRPDMQNRQLGRTLLAAAEDYARQRGARHIRMTVLHVREGLIAWYERRGYRKTGETEPFPYDDQRFGTPLVVGLHFVVLERDIVEPPAV